MADVFISYPLSAGTIVERIAAALDAEGISCWYATKDIYDRDSVGEITRKIRECKVFLLILNQDALKSRYVGSETALAFRRVINYEKMTFLPFCVDDCDWENAENAISYFLVLVQVMNGAPPDDRHIRKLCERVKRIVGGKASRRPAEANRAAEKL